MSELDRYAVIWTRTPAGPTKIGNLVATGRETRFSYDQDFLARSDVPGLSLLLPPSLLGARPFVHQATEAMPLPPRLMALLPGRNPRNVQRRLYTDLLARRQNPPAPGFDTEWELLMLAGHNGIGHIDVFRDDRHAMNTYEREDTTPQGAKAVIGSRSAFWRYLRDETSGADIEEAETLLSLIGPTPSVGGMIPKLLASIPDRVMWDGTISPTGARTRHAAGLVDTIIKIEYPEYAGLAALEGLCLELHRELGFAVPRHWIAEVDGMKVIAIERFDRTPEGFPVAMESFFSVYATGQRRVRASTDAELEQVARMLRKLAQVADIDPNATARELYRRIVMAFLTGNGDLHLENMAFLGGPRNVVLAPVFDPSPMRAWDRHNLFSALPFEIDETAGLRASVIRLGAVFGWPRAAATDLLEDLGEKTRNYVARIAAMTGVPDITRQRLVNRVNDARRKLLAAHRTH